jgi:hypothetical protein
MAGIQTFFQIALANEFYNLLVVEQRFDQRTLFSGVDPNLLQEVVKFANAFVEGMLANLSKMPPLVRYLFFEIFRAAGEMKSDDPEMAQLVLEDLFLEGMIRSVLVDPKLYGLIPETATVGCFSGPVLLRILRWRLHFTDGLERIDERVMPHLKSNPVFSVLPVAKLVEELAKPSEEALQHELYSGVTAAKVQKVTLVTDVPFLTSANDLLFLAQGIRGVLDRPLPPDIPPPSAQKLRALCDLGYDLKSDDLLDFWFTRTELPADCQGPDLPDVIPELTLPIFNTEAVPPATDRRFVHPLVSYLQTIPPSPSDPPGLFAFLEKQQQRADALGDVEHRDRTARLTAKLRGLKRPEDAIVAAVGEVIQARVVKQALTLTSAFHVQRHLEDLRRCERDVSQLNRDLEPIIHLAVVRSFLTTPDGARRFAELDANQLAFIGPGPEWQDHFQAASRDLLKYVERFKFDQASQRKLIRQLHSRFMEKLPYAKFVEVRLKEKYGEKDQRIVDGYDRLMEAFKGDSYSKPLQRVFAAPSCFRPALAILEIGTSIGTPLERLTKIGECVNVLQDIYLFEANEGCPGDDFLPLFLYALLSAKLKMLWSLAAYLRFYIVDIEDQVKMLDSREKYVATTLISSVDHIAGQVGL